MTPSNRFRAGAAVLGTALLSACASTPPISAEWTDPGLGPRSGLLRGATVLVSCEAQDIAVRNVCTDQLAAEVTARGATPIRVPSDAQVAVDRAIDPQLVPAARRLNARAVLIVTLTPAATDSGGSGLSFGIGGFGFGRNSGGGLGLSGPVGGQRVETGFSANGRVTDVSSAKLVWTASAVAPPSSDLAAQFGALSVSVLNSAEKAGLF